MYTAFIFKQGKLIPAFNGSEYDSFEKLSQSVKWYFESKRGDQSAQFIITENDVIIGIINKPLDETRS